MPSKLRLTEGVNFEGFAPDAKTVALGTSGGQIQLYQLPVARQVRAIRGGRLKEGLRSLAVPLRGPSGSVTAALNLSVHASRATMAVLRRDFLPLALRTAAAIEEDLRGTGDRRGGSFALPQS